MRKELDDQLVSKYPEIFRNRHGDPRQTLMYFGFDCGDGWYDLIDLLCKAIQSYIDQNAECVQVVAAQVKEKFGSLRFYYNGGDEYVAGLVSFAEIMSIGICEFCGTNQNVTKRMEGWIRHLCSECARKEGKRKHLENINAQLDMYDVIKYNEL